MGAAKHGHVWLIDFAVLQQHGADRNPILYTLYQQTGAAESSAKSRGSDANDVWGPAQRLRMAGSCINSSWICWISAKRSH
jgi:hypothetical protein